MSAVLEARQELKQALRNYDRSLHIDVQGSHDADSVGVLADRRRQAHARFTKAASAMKKAEQAVIDGDA